MFSLLNGRRHKVLLVSLVALVTVASSLLLFNSILGQFVFRKTISSYGTVKALGVSVYWDSNCSDPVYSIDWGLVEPGSASDVTFCIRNEGNDGVTLFLGAENWKPDKASDYLWLEWNYGGQIIDPGETVEVTLSLLASAGVESIADFTVDVVISGSG